ncbi:MAG: hypothetical protein K2K31_03355 [Clostridia bacterium]|nr:hypothetical protein [Clostridia bacterium]
MTEPKWICPVQPVTSKKVNAFVVDEMYENKLKKVVDDVKDDYAQSKFKIGNRTFVVMMADDENTLKEENLSENDQFLFEVKKDSNTGEIKFSVVQVTLDFFSDEANGCYFNGIAQVGDKKDNLFCVKRIGPDGNPVYNLAKYDTVHKKMKPSVLVSTQPITFEEGQTVCAIYARDGRVSGINTNGERTPAPIDSVMSEQDRWGSLFDMLRND